jgi:heme/copper-type cytochrome/quinol oxidase subunit 3
MNQTINLFPQSLNLITDREKKHPFHLVDPSPWPFVESFATFLMLTGNVLYMHFYSKGGFFATLGLFLVVTTAIIWWRDVIREATFEGQHTTYVQAGLKMGFTLFIVSEVMLFFAFFWAYFHSSLNPTLEIGCTWPPVGIIPMNPWGIPLLNTFILLTSGATITWAHYAMIAGYRKQVIEGSIATIILAAVFTGFQGYEYVNASFSLSDGIYGTTFYSCTGLHGLHVLVGTIFIAVCFFRNLNYHFTRTHHLGFEAASWSWHFVDVVWIFLFLAIYWWGYNPSV